MALPAGLLVLGLLGTVALSVTGSGDYRTAAPVNADNAAPAMSALLHGNLAGFVSHQPLMGLTTILMRLPFAAFASALGGGEMTIYKLGAFACLLPLAFGAAWLIAAPGLTLKQRLLRLVTVLIVIESPILRSALEMGHPEDLVAAVLATAAVIAARSGRVRWAALLLGLAVGSKEWALIAVLPVMIASPGRRLEVGVIAVAVVALCNGVEALLDPAAFWRGVHAERGAMALSPLSPLWPFGVPIRLLGGGAVRASREIPWGMARAGALEVQLGAASLLGAVWYARLWRRGIRCDPICLLALLGAVRCICDTVDWQYYWLAMLIPVAAWESTENRLPVGAVGLSLMAWALFGAMGHISSTLIYLASLAAGAGLIAYLGSQAIVNDGAGSTSGTPSGLPISQAARRMYRMSRRKLGVASP